MAVWDKQPPRLSLNGWNPNVPPREIRYRVDGVDWKFKNLDDAVMIVIELQNRRLGGPEGTEAIPDENTVIDAEYRDVTDTKRLPSGGTAERTPHE
jgi:hypothetical protein